MELLKEELQDLQQEHEAYIKEHRKNEKNRLKAIQVEIRFTSIRGTEGVQLFFNDLFFKALSSTNFDPYLRPFLKNLQ